jgi:hypothetical protein
LGGSIQHLINIIIKLFGVNVAVRINHGN